ncbi:hypothetical protein EMCRGX_G020208 [Ephydatia muelleri]
MDSGQDSVVGGVGVVHIRSRSQPASGGTEEEDGEEDDKGSGMLSVRTGSKHTSGSDNSEAVSVPPSSTGERHGSLLSLSRRSLTTKELTDSAYSSGMSTRPLEMSIATPTRSALIRKGSGGILEARGDACADEPVMEWSALGPIGEKKQKAINSLMNTEFHFCEVLRAGIVMYLDPLRDVLSPVHHETIFHNLEELYRLSYDTSTQLKACCQPYCSSAPVPYYVESVGSIYHSKIDRLLAVVVSCQNQQTQSHNQISYCLASNKAFNALVQNAGQSLSIHSFVGAINEYLPKLARYLMGVSYFTPLWHEDHKYLTSIVKALLKVCPDKDLRDKWLMDQDMMENLKVRLGFETGVQPFTIVIPGRVLLNEGEVSLVVEKKKKKKIWLMLFSDILVLAKKQGKVLATTETPFLLEQLTVNDLNCDETEFQVQSVDGKIKRLMRVGSAQEKGEWMLMLKEWTSGTHTMPNGVPTRHTASSASRLGANSNGLLCRNGSVSVHKVPSPPKIVSSSLTQPDSGGFSPSEHYVPFSQPTDFAQNGVQPRLRAMTTTAVRSHSVAATKHTADDVDVSRRSMFAGSAGTRSDRPSETKDDRAKDKRRAPPPFTSQRRLGATSQDRPSDTPKVSAKMLQEWEKSFESLMANPEGIILFEEFLKTEYSDENILFWKACERYSKLPREKLQAEADKIYQEFLCEKSPKLVNLDHHTMTSVVASIREANQNTFKKAQNSIFMLMGSDSYKRFINSDKFQSALR